MNPYERMYNLLVEGQFHSGASPRNLSDKELKRYIGVLINQHHTATRDLGGRTGSTVQKGLQKTLSGHLGEFKHRMKAAETTFSSSKAGKKRTP
jgi:hypothetical protein